MSDRIFCLAPLGSSHCGNFSFFQKPRFYLSSESSIFLHLLPEYLFFLLFICYTPSLGLGTNTSSSGVILLVSTCLEQCLQPVTLLLLVCFLHNSFHKGILCLEPFLFSFYLLNQEIKLYERILKGSDTFVEYINGQANYFEKFFWMGARRRFFLATLRQRA